MGTDNLYDELYIVDANGNTYQLKNIKDAPIVTSMFDQEEIHRNCTVQILKNSVTGEISIGWWENDKKADT